MVILIPIYKINLSKDEIISLKQCFKILGNHEIQFVAPIGLDISKYEDILNERINVEYFPSHYFQNIRGYNQLMLSLEFYKRFISFDYMLIYQLDCYVFKDELEFWCKKGYDYIGSPWLDYTFYNKSKLQKIQFLVRQYFKIRFKKIDNKAILAYQSGNGGFSLRKIQKFIQVLSNSSNSKLDKFRNSNDSLSLYNEDVFWSFEANGIKKPNYKMSTKFGLDSGADIGIRLNQGLLPFGCHAWHKNKAFWSKYIEL